MPVQSNRRRKRDRSVRGELAPWLITVGTMLRLAISTDMQKGRAFGSAHPLVGVGGVVGGADGLDIERDHAGSVGSVDKGVDAPSVISATIRSTGNTSPVGLVT